MDYRRLASGCGWALSACFGWAVASYQIGAAIAAAVVLVLTVTLSSRCRWPALIVSASACTLVLGTSFGTVTGYFWLNRHRLDALIAAIDRLPSALRSIEIGQEDDLRSSTIARFDSYRFVNGEAVTLYRRQAAPGALQPVSYVDDVLKRLRMPREGYDRLNRTLERLSLSGFARGPNGEIRLSGVARGGAPLSTEFVYRPDEHAPVAPCVIEQRRLSAHWFWMECG